MKSLSEYQKSLLLKRPIQPWLFNLIFAVFLAGPSNYPLWMYLSDLYPLGASGSLFFLIIVFTVLASLFYTIMALFSLIRADKAIAILIILINSVVLYFMNRFSVIIDMTMIQNVMQTDIAEATELSGFGMFFYILFFGLIPVLCTFMVRLDHPKTLKGHLMLLRTSIVSVALIGMIAATHFQDFASLIRNHKEVRYHILPNNYVNAGFKTIKNALVSGQKNTIILSDAKKNSSWNTHAKKTLFVFVVGETARAENFSLNGYNRQTTPLLAQKDIINFTNMFSCGTSTAVSLPCIFSPQGREKFNTAGKYNPNNLMQLMNRAGFKATWIDNNSGCKGICNGIETVTTADLEKKYGSDHQSGEVYDETMLQALDTIIKDNIEDRFIVLHQKGSHGPAYYLRTPESFHHFKPMCMTAELSKCSREEIVNSYDNTILYTDYFLSKVIDRLELLSKDYNTAMIYVSDHGESLGEKNIYLHGFPYMIAPDEQKHVPSIMWLSEGFKIQQNIKETCLQNKKDAELSHDYFFHTILDVLDVQTELKENTLSLFNQCRGINEKSAQAF